MASKHGENESDMLVEERMMPGKTLGEHDRLVHAASASRCGTKDETT